MTDERLASSRDAAASAIEQARARGVEPVLSVSLFEFAGAQEDVRAALELYRSAGLFAGFSQVLVASEEPHPSRFIGPWQDAGAARVLAIQDAYKSVAVGWFLIGMFAATTVAILVLAAGRR